MVQLRKSTVSPTFKEMNKNSVACPLKHDYFLLCLQFPKLRVLEVPLPTRTFLNCDCLLFFTQAPQAAELRVKS